MTDDLALYVHWPFCLAKCPYCDFNSHVREAVPHDRWRAALLAELDRHAARIGPRRLTSIFFGGGTPSLMAPETAAAVIDRAIALWPADDDIEITLEANPTSVEAGRFSDFRGAGVNRVSLGVQALDDAALAFLGRQHTAKEALAAATIAARHFPRHSIDLIYARPGQTVAAWRDELRRALDYAGDHISVYQLTIERGTPFFAAARRGAFALPDEDDAAVLYEATQEDLDRAGLPAYEISNHARPGGECRHNLAYWAYRDYVGIGPGAHGRLTLDGKTVATEAASGPEKWLGGIESGAGATRETAVSREEAFEEAVMMGLRLTRGIARERLDSRFGTTVEEAFDADRLAALTSEGLIEIDRDGIRATAAGRQRLNAVLGYLLADGRTAATA